MIGASVARIVIYSTGKVVSVNALKEEVVTQLHSFLASALDTAVKFAPRPFTPKGKRPTEWEDGLAVKVVVPTGWRCVGRTVYSLDPGVKFRDRKSEAINQDTVTEK